MACGIYDMSPRSRVGLGLLVSIYCHKIPLRLCLQEFHISKIFIYPRLKKSNWVEFVILRVS